MSIITTINSGDLISGSRTDINNNFASLNTNKIETSVLDTDTSLTANSDLLIPSQKAIKAYVDVLGGANASETVRGVVEEASDAEVTAGTATGATGAKLFVTPAKLATRMASSTAPAITTFTSSGTWTKPAGLKYIVVEVQSGGGGGGQGGGNYGKSDGNNGGSSSFGTHASATGGIKGLSSSSSGLGGVGASGNLNINGGSGSRGLFFSSSSATGGNGGNGFFSGAGQSPGGNGFVGGGGGGGDNYYSNFASAGGGGGAGGYSKKLIAVSTLGSTETVTVGAGGAGGDEGHGGAGGAGGPGIVIVTEYYV